MGSRRATRTRAGRARRASTTWRTRRATGSILGVRNCDGKPVRLFPSEMSSYWKEELYGPAAHPPKGPAGAAFLQRTMQAFPLGPPLQFTPAGISETSRQFTSNDSKAGHLRATRGKSVAAALLREFVPGTFVLTVIATKSEPVPSAETAHVYGLKVFVSSFRTH